MSRSVPKSKLALGTVQFGLPYGIANTSGQVTMDEGRAILATAAGSGIDTLDTAIAYGESEATIGPLHTNRFRVVTKLSAVPEDVADIAQWIRSQVDRSLARLQLTKVEGLLLHRPHQLLGPRGPEIYRELAALRDDGLVRRIGISIYEPQQLDALSAFHFDLVQAPVSVFDQRMQRSGWLDRLQQSGTAFHARSVFLQGLLLLPAERRPALFEAWQDTWSLWDHWLAANKLTALQSCLRFVAAIPAIERIVVGVDSDVQLQSILAAIDGPMPDLPDEFGHLPPALLNPSNWSTP